MPGSPSPTQLILPPPSPALQSGCFLPACQSAVVPVETEGGQSRTPLAMLLPARTASGPSKLYNQGLGEVKGMEGTVVMCLEENAWSAGKKV